MERSMRHEAFFPAADRLQARLRRGAIAVLFWSAIRRVILSGEG